MSSAVSPLKENPHFVNMLTKFENPFMGIIVGIAFTAVLQSASASVGIPVSYTHLDVYKRQA